MLILLVAAMAAQAPSQVAAPDNSQSSPDIVVQGKPKLVCTTVRVTGSRAARSRRCVTKEDAAMEKETARRLVGEAASIASQRDASACGPPSIQSCD